MFLSGSRAGRRRWLAFGLAALATPALASPDALPLELSLEDVDAVVFVSGGAALRLQPEAAEHLRAITKQHIGRVLELSIDGLFALRVRIHAEITSGIVQLPDPSPALRQRLQAKELSKPVR